MLFLDNVKIIKDALAKEVIVPKCILTSMEILPFDPKTKEVYLVDDKTIEQLADTKTPQKVLCIAYLSQYVVEKPKTNFLVLDGLQDPGNVGTLIRTAFASGFEYVFLVNSVKRNNSKLIRSSVGAVFDSKVFEMTRKDFVEFAKQHNLKLICCDMNGENIFDFKPNTDQILGVVVGNEGQGVSDEIANICYKTIKIPMKAGIESLNAGVSGSIIMYEINKRRI
ncbi:MAG: TrmH family RNA methyltransferase [Candidatus Caccovivens sp.]